MNFKKKIKIGDIEVIKPSLEVQLKMNKKYLKTVSNEIAGRLVDKVEILSDNSEGSCSGLISELLGKNILTELSSEEIWNLYDVFHNKLAELNIIAICPDKFKNAIVGLPFNIPSIFTKVNDIGKTIFAYERKASCGFKGEKTGDFEIAVYDSVIVKRNTFICHYDKPETSAIYKIDNKVLQKILKLISKEQAELNKMPNKIENESLDESLYPFKFND